MRIALALGSGGARGYAHIGVLAALADRDHEVVAIAGTSMGALVGGLYAAGRLDEYTEWVTGLSQRDVLLLLDPALTSPGIIRAERISERVADILDGVRIEELAIPFTAVATDLTSQREVWFQHGPVSAAIRASIAIPSAITPVMLHGHLLVDGGLLNPVPVDVLGGATADVTVGVDLNGQASSGLGGPPVTESADENPSNGWLEVIRRTAGRMSW